jgi:hypothetical protein
MTLRVCAGEAGEDRCVGVFGEDLFGCRGEMLGGSAGGVELQDQCSGLFAEGGFHAGQLAHLLAGESGVQLIDPCIDVALAASGDEQSAQSRFGEFGGQCRGGCGGQDGARLGRGKS